ncbi:VC2662 family protein [Psychromonas hadalis]|uniref:VC2662 family protein n=1 Tax=Psychromonas hadalis TaxID=211669 RepID=UPI0003B34938|nr:hypothetical protein [Psychromonas hadalis]
MKKTVTTLALLSAFTVPHAIAENAPVMFSSTGFNAPANTTTVKGFRLAMLHGKVDNLVGVDFALFGLSETKTTMGANLNFFGAAKVTEQMTGASFGLVNIMQGEVLGANFGIVNLTNNVEGANISVVNYSKGNTMVDVGIVSFSKESLVQVGIFNKTEKITAVQVGIWNCADNGFFKCFPLFNIPK